MPLRCLFSNCTKRLKKCAVGMKSLSGAIPELDQGLSALNTTVATISDKATSCSSSMAGLASSATSIATSMSDSLDKSVVSIKDIRKELASLNGTLKGFRGVIHCSEKNPDGTTFSFLFKPQKCKCIVDGVLSISLAIVFLVVSWLAISRCALLNLQK